METLYQHIFGKVKGYTQWKIKEQKTTTHCTGITVAKQYRYHMQVENKFQFLCDNNTGILLDGHTFGDVFEYFVLGDDETF